MPATAVQDQAAHRVRRHVTQIVVPDEARSLGTLERIDYADAFVVDGVSAPNAESWARAVIDGASLETRVQLVLGWTALGLRLGPPWSPGRILGWPFARREPNFVLLAARSWLGFEGQLLFVREPTRLLFATFIQQRGPVARRVWGVTAARHQRVVKALLRRASVAM